VCGVGRWVLALCSLPGSLPCVHADWISSIQLVGAFFENITRHTRPFSSYRCPDSSPLHITKPRSISPKRDHPYFSSPQIEACETIRLKIILVVYRHGWSSEFRRNVWPEKTIEYVVDNGPFRLLAQKIWNSLPIDTTPASSLTVFKQRLKTFLFRCCDDMTLVLSIDSLSYIDPCHRFRFLFNNLCHFKNMLLLLLLLLMMMMMTMMMNEIIIVWWCVWRTNSWTKICRLLQKTAHDCAQNGL